MTDAAFVHLANTRRLNMSGCSRVGDAGFAHLSRLVSLDMRYCTQGTLTGAAFHALTDLRFLTLSADATYCNAAAAALPAGCSIDIVAAPEVIDLTDLSSDIDEEHETV